MGKRKARRKRSLLSRALDWVAIGIGASPAIKTVVDHGSDVQGSLDIIADGYSGGILHQGKPDFGTVLYWYGPILAAVGFRKGMSLLMKVARGR